ncbi:DUF6933 domain-containing protein [Aliivibrio salmonicida]|jgi:hypothetical protein|uniref:DUF6933 domain-containing protein n=2 Tax=Aliivibrio TaxID=511678 RepID=A0A090I9V3_9GAMM|nr:MULTISPECIES: hypothetical protein [Aliivibrio]MDD9177057.1 hypothetical protein [Aliivibrio sp. S3TY1]MDD9194104.1 hypothetical protein [Aliivibrio sp. S2TY2]OCH29956.1 hypothetical protein A6E13_19105 [Aliivibrio fischeri]CED57152.1 putative uncharacterized protein [Aliivibrio wodanis]
MFQFKCTKKVQDFIGLKPSDLNEIESERFVLGNWFVNSFTQNRRKVLVFMEEKTLFSFIIIGVRKEHIKTLRKHFLEGLCLQLKAEGISPQTIAAFSDNQTIIQYTKTDNRSKVGSMTDLIYLYSTWIDSEGGLSEIDVVDLGMKLNRVPQTNLKLTYAINELKQALGETT